MRSRLLHRVLDVGINWLALSLAYLIKKHFSIGVPTEPLTGQVVLHTFAVVALLWVAVGSVMEMYNYKRRLFPEIVSLIAALAITIAFFNTYVYFTRLFIFPLYGMVFYAVIGTTLLIVSRSIGLRDPVITGRQSVVKRCFDIAVASFCFVLALPLFIVVPILIWIDSKGHGPIIFSQERVG